MKTERLGVRSPSDRKVQGKLPLIFRGKVIKMIIRGLVKVWVNLGQWMKS
jgi:hypothetical protein